MNRLQRREGELPRLEGEENKLKREYSEVYTRCTVVFGVSHEISKLSSSQN